MTSSDHPKVLEPVATSTQPYPLFSPVVVGHALSGSLKPGRASARVSWVPPLHPSLNPQRSRSIFITKRGKIGLRGPSLQIQVLWCIVSLLCNRDLDRFLPGPSRPGLSVSLESYPLHQALC